MGQNFKQRGEWVELQFMAEAALHGYHVLTPWGDSLTYDVAIDQAAHLLRVQVKSTSATGARATTAGFAEAMASPAMTSPELISSPATSSPPMSGT